MLEKHNLPGGSATSFRRGRFEFEPSLHELAQVGSEENPGAVRELFKEFGADVDWHHENHTYRVISTDLKEKYDASMPCGIEEFCDEMEKQVPGCRASVKRLFEFGLSGLKTMSALGAGQIKPIDMILKHKDFMRMASHSADECMDLIGIDKKAQHILTTYWPYVGEATDTLSCMTFCMMLLVYVIYGAGMPGMFSHELSLALEKVIRDHDGEIWYNCPVTKILIKNGTILNKWSDEDIPDEYVLTDKLENLSLGKQKVSSDTHTVGYVFLWFVIPLLLVLGVDVLVVRRRERKNAKRKQQEEEMKSKELKTENPKIEEQE